MRYALILSALLLSARTVQAQTPIVIGPNTQFQFDVATPSVAAAQSLTYVVTTNATPPATITLTGVTCVTLTSTTQTCGVPASQLPVGSLSVTMTAASGSVVSLPSAPFAYIDFVIPIPQGLRYK